ncbi:hypothetical protein [Sphingomonas sp. 1P08PE]|uniref:hypothetical protein n=1 Tax=Sphingomonas sp. 1P08PE TaxID=554122 RepID=UPI0039A008A4
MISKPDAATALVDIERIDRRTSRGSAYVRASSHLLIGGATWTLGYVACGLLPPAQWGAVWIPLILLGTIGSFVIGYVTPRTHRRDPAERPIEAARILWMTATTMAFVVVSFLLFRPTDPVVFLTYPALVMAFVYALLGSLGLPRFRWLGTGMFAVLILGLLVGRDAIAFWVAAAGGGGLLLGAAWLRKA